VKLVVFSLLWGAALFAQPTPAPARRPAAAQAEAPPPAIKPEDKCTIEGTVINASTGEPLKKARLTLRGMGGPNGTPSGATTDNAGHFLIDDLDPGEYNFSASRNGFVSARYSADGDSKRPTSITLTNGQKMSQVVFKLTPQGVIAGRILDDEGDPLNNVMVQCMVYGYSRGKRQLMGQEGTNTNDLGEFRLAGLKPGKYILSATYQGSDVLQQAQTVKAATVPEERYTTTYYPNTARVDNASQIEVAAGAQITGINMTLARVRTVRVKGHLNVGPAGKARRNVAIMLVPRDNTVGSMMQRMAARNVDAQGNFQLRGVAPGSYLLRADVMEENARLSARMPLEVGSSNIEGIELALQPPGQIQGRVVVEENGDLKGARLNVRMQPRVSGPNMGGGNGGQVKDDLTFLFANIGPDPYDINVGGLPEGFYLKSVRLGQTDVTETGVDFTQGFVGGDLTIVVNPNGGQIDGTVKNAKGDPAKGLTVTLIPDDAHKGLIWLYKTANTDQNGTFSIKSVRPGDYKLYAWEDIESGAYQDPDFVKPHESAGESVTVKQSSHENLQLKAIPAAKTPAA
jgi:uncharacterized surface anchored protein